jgi:hypothetical protein
VVITELSKLSNGGTTSGAAAPLHISLEGCSHRGSTTCFDCPLAMRRAKECDYRCAECDARKRCPCGQERRVTCSCGGRLEILPLHYQGRPRWARQCVECGTIWSVGGWHQRADELQEEGGRPNPRKPTLPLTTPMAPDPWGFRRNVDRLSVG